MREVNIGGEKYNMVASPITLHFYKKEFNTDLLGDFMTMREMDRDPSKFNAILFLQIAWAMIKTSKGGQFLNFEQWISEIDEVKFDDLEMISSIVEEAEEGFFS